MHRYRGRCITNAVVCFELSKLRHEQVKGNLIAVNGAFDRDIPPYWATRCVSLINAVISQTPDLELTLFTLQKSNILIENSNR